MAAGLIRMSIGIRIRQDGASAIFCLGKCVGCFPRPGVPPKFILVVVGILVRSRRDLAINIFNITARERQLIKKTGPFRISAVIAVVEGAVGIQLRFVVDAQTGQELLAGISLRHVDAGDGSAVFRTGNGVTFSGLETRGGCRSCIGDGRSHMCDTIF